MIYIIGDSHVSVFSGTDKSFDGKTIHIQPEFGTCYTLSKGQLKQHINRFEQRIPYFCPIKIGSTTAYNLEKMLPTIEQVIKEYNIGENDYLFTCYGEIDIRNHIGHNAFKKNISVYDGIKICVDRYVDAVLTLNNRNFKLGIYGPPPSSPNYGSSVNEFKDVLVRNKMTIQFSDYLKEKCLKYNIIFKSISDKIILENGETNMKFMMDKLHLSQESMTLLINEFSDII